MKRSKWIHFLALALLLAMAVGAIPAAMATEDSAVEQTAPDSVSDEPLNVEPEASAAESPEPEPTPSQQPTAAEEAQKETEEPAEDQEPTDMNGETLTRHAMTTEGPRRARSAAYGTVGKSTCVEFSGYTSPYWYCNRYNTQGTHVYGHYYYAATIAYHTVDGEYSYCIEPNTSSINGATYYSYNGNSAASDSYWMLELDSWQRYYIQQIMAFGYPAVDRGYSAQAQYARFRNPMAKKRSICSYSPEGRKGLHDNLQINTGLMLKLMRQPLYGESAEYADNRISLFSAQWGRCAITGKVFQITADIHCHHKVLR